MRKFETSGAYPRQLWISLRTTLLKRGQRLSIWTIAVTTLVLLAAMLLFVEWNTSNLVFTGALAVSMCAYAVFVPVNTTKKLIAHMSEHLPEAITDHAWFIDEGLCFMDEIDNEDTLCLMYWHRIRYYARTADVLLLSDGGDKIVGVHLNQLDEADRNAVLALVLEKCPRIREITLAE